MSYGLELWFGCKFYSYGHLKILGLGMGVRVMITIITNYNTRKPIFINKINNIKIIFLK